MQKFKKPLSILLTIILVLSVFTIIPLTSASAASVQVFARKWVRAEQVDGDYFSFTDLYQNFIICRCNRYFDETNYNVDDTTNVYNRTQNMSLTNHNEIRLNSWDGDNGRLGYYWSDNSDNAGNGKIYLSTNGDNNINFNTDDVEWYAYTWETFNADEVAATYPTYSNGDYQYGYGGHYAAGSRNFIAIEGTTDNHQNVRQISLAEVKIPYFEYEYLSELNTIRLAKCNSDDTDITVPDTIPSRFYPSDAPAGMVCSIIKEEAFKDRTSLVNVTIGDNVNHLAGKKISDNLKGAFYGCDSLETVTIGSNFDYAGSDCFEGCRNLTDFTTTATKELQQSSGITKIASDNKNLRTLKVHCYHDSSITLKLNNDHNITFDFIDNPVEHTYEAWDWNWNDFNVDDPFNSDVYATISCSVCNQEIEVVKATVVQVVDEEPTCVENGYGHYRGIVEYEDETFVNDPLSYYDYNKFPYIIPATPNDHDWNTAASAVDWTWTPDGGEDPGLSDITATATVQCKNCETTQTLNAVVEYTGSDLPGCTTPGSAHYTASAQCGGDTLLDTKDYTLPATGHSMDHHAAVDATATEPGSIEYWSCSECGKYFYDSDGENEITDHNSVIIPELNLVEVGKVFEVGDQIVIPAGTTIKMYGKTGSTPSDVTINERTVTTVKYDDTQNDGKHGRIWLDGYSNDYLRSATSNSDYVFTGCYRFVDEFNNGKLVAEPLFYKTATEPAWTWATGDEPTIVTLSDFYDAATDGTAVDYSQTIVADIDDGVVITEATLSTDGEKLYTATATAYHGTFTSTNTEPIPKTAPAYTIENERYYSSFSAAADSALGYNGELTVGLLKNISDNYIFPAEKAAYTLKVRKDGYSVTVKAPEGYHVNTSTSDGVTSYWLHKLTEHAAVAPTYNRNTNTIKSGYPHYWSCDKCNKVTLSPTAEPWTYRINPIYYYQYDWDGFHAVLKAYNGSDSEIYIPANIPNGFPGMFDTSPGKAVTYIDECAFQNKTVLTKVEAPAVTNIGYRAFYGCANLEEFYAGANLSFIGSEVFGNCPNLKKFYTTATSIGLQNHDVFNGSPNVIVYAPHNSAYKGWARSNGRKFIGIDAHDAPRWNWTGNDEDGYTAATATFKCSRCDVNETVNATVTSATADGITTYTATVELEGNTYTDTKEVFTNGICARLEGHSVSLQGDIAVNFYVRLSPAVNIQTAYMQFSVPNTSNEYQSQKVYVKDLQPVFYDNKQYYVFKCRIPAKDMNAQITATFIDGENTCEFAPYSVEDYADYLLAHQEVEEYAKAKDLITAMLVYGDNAAYYFNTTTDKPEDISTVISTGIQQYSSPEYFDLPQGVTFTGATLSLKSQLSLSLYFTSDHNIQLSCEGQTVETANSGNEYVIRIRNIPTAELNNNFTVKIGGNDAVSYSPLEYCYKAQSSSNEKLVNTVKALYLYWVEAYNYFNNGGN